MDETSPSPRAAFIAKLGAWLQAVSLVGGVIGVAQASKAISTANGQEQASEAIGDLLTFAELTQSVSISGLILITVAITFHRYRAAWMYHFLCFYGLMMIGINLCLLLFSGFSFNVHLLFGLFFLGFVIVKKAEFQSEAKAAHKLPSCYKLDS